MPKNKCKTCACGCSTRYAHYSHDGQYWMNKGHWKKWKEKAKEEAEKNASQGTN